METLAESSTKSCHPRARSAAAAAEELVIEYLPLVKIIARQVFGSLPVHATVELSDIVQAGHLGLVHASKAYRAGMKVPFGSYARHRIRGEILDSLRKLDPASRSLRRWQRRVDNETREFRVTFQREPTDEEMSRRLGSDLSKYRKKRLAVWHSASCAAIPPAEDERQPAWIVSRESTPDRLHEVRQLRQVLLKKIEVLPQRSRKVVTAYYLEDMTMKQIGRMLSVNESRISQIHKSALQALAEGLRESGIRSFVDL